MKSAVQALSEYSDKGEVIHFIYFLLYLFDNSYLELRTVGDH